ncbi:cytochrome P450 [soil metagenome]
MALPRNALEAVVHTDPYPYYEQLRRDQPLFYDPGLKLWVASNHAVVSAAFAEPLLLVRPPSEPVPQALAGTPVAEVFAMLVRMSDGSFHAGHKPAVMAAASRWPAGQLGDVSREVTLQLLPHIGINEFLTELPVRVMARLLGVAPTQLDQTSRWVHDFTRAIAAGASPEAIGQGCIAAEGLMQQGLAGGMTRVQAANRIGFMQQSLDATAGLLGNTARLLQAQPDLLRLIQDSDDLARGVVAEVARWDAPVQNTRRFASAGLQLAGLDIRRGDAVLLVLASANRDEAFNAQPDLFDAMRQGRRSMTFGAAAHACPGELIAIEIVAACLASLGREKDGAHWFGDCMGYRALPNARVPVFSR